MRQFWRLTALPGARSYKATESEGLDDGCHALRMTIPDTYRNLSTVEGVRGESNPPLSASQTDVQKPLHYGHHE